MKATTQIFNQNWIKVKCSKKGEVLFYMDVNVRQNLECNLNLVHSYTEMDSFYN